MKLLFIFCFLSTVLCQNATETIEKLKPYRWFQQPSGTGTGTVPPKNDTEKTLQKNGTVVKCTMHMYMHQLAETNTTTEAPAVNENASNNITKRDIKDVKDDSNVDDELLGMDQKPVPHKSLKKRETQATSNRAKNSLNNVSKSVTETPDSMEKSIDAKENENQKLLRKCPKFKNGVDMHIRDMIGEWETVYQQMNKDISCFKVNITAVNQEDRRHCKERYGDDGNTINWDLCQVSIASSTADPKVEKHCLLGEHGSKHNFGIFDNIVVSAKDKISNDSVVVMRGEPDQWRIIHDLLILRDCSNGSIVVFSKTLKTKPSLDEILHALEVFGESNKKGKLLCDDSESFVGGDDDELDS